MITVLWWMRVIILQFMITIMHIHFIYTILTQMMCTWLPCPTLNRLDNMMRYVLLFFWFSDLSVYNIWTITIRLDCMQTLTLDLNKLYFNIIIYKIDRFPYLQDMLKILINQKIQTKKCVTFIFYSTNIDNYNNIMHFSVNVMGDEIVGWGLICCK